MKMTKKLFLGAVAVLAIAFSGCKMKEDSDKAISGGEINYQNEDTAKYYRCFQTRATKHYDAVAKFEITQNAITNGQSSNGVSGFMFGLTKNEDNTYNFAVVSLRINSNKKAEYYISYYKNVAGGDKLKTPASNFLDKNDVVITTPPTAGCLATETQIAPTSGSWALVSDYRYDSDVACLTVVVDQVKGNGTEIDYTATGMRTNYHKGDYRVRIFSAPKLGSDKMPATDSNKHISAIADVDEIITCQAAENIKNDQGDRIQKDIGYYFNVYKGNKLTSKIKFTDIRGNAIVEDEID